MSSTKSKNKIHLLILTGSVGVGKSSVAEAISNILSSKSIPNAIIDLDYLRHAHPEPQNDPFHMKLGYKNLASIWRNYEDIGITHLIIPNVVENKKELKEFKSAIPNADIHIIRLKADIKTIHDRLKRRDTGESLKWHLNRAIVLTKQLKSTKIEDLVVDTKNKFITTIAKEIIFKIGWL
mgnify:FL=1